MKKLLHSIVDIFRSIKWWFLYRTFNKFHIIDTGLKPGYYDKDQLMLNAMFSLLVDYVEYELAWMSYACSSEDTKVKPNKSNGRELGLKYLCEEPDQSTHSIRIVSDEDREIRDLYIWWKDVRPHRDSVVRAINSKKSRRRLQSHYKDELFYNEDTRMMVRLARVRGSMWT